MQRFGKKMRTLRTRHGMTVRELAAALGYNSFGLISEVETGRRLPSLHLAIQVSRLFGVPVETLVKDEIEMD